jgi:hypothetical protein
MTDPFYDNSQKLCKSIISQRLVLLRFNKSKVSDTDQLRIATEELNNEFEKYRSSSRTMAYFIKNNYVRLVSICPHNAGFESRINKLYELYKQSIQLA